MDTTSKYIQMCEKAEEIQNEKQSERVSGDFFYDKGIEKICIYGCSWIRNHDDSIHPEVIWLPGQDQLQEIIDNKSEPVNIAHELCEWIYKPFLSSKPAPDNWFNYVTSFNSLEQLWLAFVMYEKYDKVWSDKKEKWVKREREDVT
jgi:hypothetical protein